MSKGPHELVHKDFLAQLLSDRDEWKARAEKAEKRTKITEFFKDPGTGECCFRDADGREMYMSEDQAVGVSDALSYRERMLEWKVRAEKAESEVERLKDWQRENFPRVTKKDAMDLRATLEDFGMGPADVEKMTIVQVVAWLKARAECLDEDIEELRGSITSADMTKRSLLAVMLAECVSCINGIEYGKWKEGR